MANVKFDAVQGVGYVLDGEGGFDEAAHPRDEKGRFTDTEGRANSHPEIKETRDRIKAQHAALGPTAPKLTVNWRDYEKTENGLLVKGPSGKDMYGHVIDVRLEDPKHREASVRTVKGPMSDKEASKMLEEMHTEIKGRIKEQKTRKRYIPR